MNICRRFLVNRCHHTRDTIQVNLKLHFISRTVRKSPFFVFLLDTHPGVSHMFQAAAFRFGHTLIPPGIYRRDAKCNYRTTNMGFPAIRLCSTWWDSNVRNIVVHLMTQS